MSEKIYCGKAKRKTTDYGEIFLLSMYEDVLKDVIGTQNDSGYLNLTMVKRREPDNQGNDYYVYMPKVEAKVEKKVAQTPIENDDIPF